MAARSMIAPIWLEVAARLQSLGFKKRAGEVFTLEVSDEVLGWIGLNRASRHLPAGVFEVSPVVGIRHQGVERLVAQLRGEEFHTYQPPTVSTQLGYLLPARRFRAWVLGGPDASDASIDELVAAVSESALPFMRSGSIMATLCRLLDEGLGFEHQLVYRRPVAWMLAGDLQRAVSLVEEAESELGDRTDAAAAEFRSFARGFRLHLATSED